MCFEFVCNPNEQKSAWKQAENSLLFFALKSQRHNAQKRVASAENSAEAAAATQASWAAQRDVDNDKQLCVCKYYTESTFKLV